MDSKRKEAKTKKGRRSRDVRLVVGWREWVSLPALGIPAIKAKIDTGARTSSIHAFRTDVFTERGIQKVRFSVHPIQGRNDIVVTCEANVVDHRLVSDSGGHRERRYVIEVPILIGGLEYPIEITLANRSTMSFRMLLGRTAMANLLVEPSSSYLLGKTKAPSRAYARTPRKKS